MKIQFALLSFTLFAFASTISFAQDSILIRQPPTNMQQVLETKGTVIKQEFIELNMIATMSSAFMTVEDISTHRRIKGMRFMKRIYRPDNTYDQITYLDREEIESFNSFLNFANSLSSKPELYTEYHYRSRGNFEVSVAAHQKNSGVLTGDWDYFIIVNSDDSESRFQLNKLDFNIFVIAMAKGSTLFTEK